MPNFVIHVGPHKTGTKYLQRCLAFHADRLRLRGIVVPTERNHSPENPSHDSLIQRLNAAGFSELEAKFGRLRAARVKTVVISAEDISTLSAEGLAMLRELVGAEHRRFLARAATPVLGRRPLGVIRNPFMYPQAAHKAFTG